MSTQADLYFSVDIEADGPIPGEYSMLSFGLVVAARFDGERFEAREPERTNFYRELRPITDRLDPAALEVAHLDRDQLLRNGADPEVAMSEAADWVREVAAEDRPVIVAFPAPFDWMFLYWYFVRFSRSGSPFGFSACLDMKTMLQQRTGVTLEHAGLDELPPEVKPKRPHTHNALEDALAQAEIFQKLWGWLE
jgi:DNA polymerase III epsilon subunit-like protein